VRYAPLDAGLFLSASADWSIRVWRDAQPATPVAIFVNPSKRAFNDAVWSPVRPGTIVSISFVAGDRVSIRAKNFLLLSLVGT
jgi:WD40 repeat protein